MPARGPPGRAASSLAPGVRERAVRAAGERAGFRPDTFNPFFARLPRIIDPTQHITYEGLRAHGLDPVVSRFVAQTQGDYAAAHVWYAKALVTAHRGGSERTADALDALAAIAAAQEQVVRAARLWGAANSLREASGATISPSDRAKNDQAITAARAQLGEAAFAAAWAAGRAMRLEQAIAYALGESG